MLGTRTVLVRIPYYNRVFDSCHDETNIVLSHDGIIFLQIGALSIVVSFWSFVKIK